MRLLFFYSHPFNPLNGGIERVTDTLAREFVGKGVEVYYLFGHVNESVTYSPIHPQKCYALPEEDFFKSENNLSFFRSLISQNKIDIVVNQSGMWSYPNPMLGLGDVKYVSAIHSVPSAELVKHRTMYFVRRRGLAGYLKYLVKILMFPFYGTYLQYKSMRMVREHYHYLIEHSDRVVVLAEGYIKELNKIIGYKAENVVAIGNPNTFEVPPVDISKKEKVVLYVGRLDPVFKQPLLLIRIWRKLYKDFPDWKLIFVGDGISRVGLERYVQRCKIERVTFEGAKRNVEDYYRIASVVCLVSKCEGWGMALTEGMASGCVPICFNNYSASMDIIDDGVNGFLVTPFSKNEYVNKLRQLMLNNDQRNKMALAAQKKVMLFSKERISDKWMELLTNL